MYSLLSPLGGTTLGTHQLHAVCKRVCVSLRVYRRLHNLHTNKDHQEENPLSLNQRKAWGSSDPPLNLEECTRTNGASLLGTKENSLAVKPISLRCPPPAGRAGCVTSGPLSSAGAGWLQEPAHSTEDGALSMQLGEHLGQPPAPASAARSGNRVSAQTAGSAPAEDGEGRRNYCLLR